MTNNNPTREHAIPAALAAILAEEGWTRSFCSRLMEQWDFPVPESMKRNGWMVRVNISLESSPLMPTHWTAQNRSGCMQPIEHEAIGKVFERLSAALAEAAAEQEGE